MTVFDFGRILDRLPRYDDEVWQGVASIRMRSPEAQQFVKGFPERKIQVIPSEGVNVPGALGDIRVVPNDRIPIGVVVLCDHRGEVARIINLKDSGSD